MSVMANLVGGTWQAGSDRVRNFNPSDLDDCVSEHALADDAVVHEAIDHAAAAFERWRHSAPEERFRVLETIGAEILSRSDELGRTLSREQGKTLANGVAEARRAGTIFKFYASEALRQEGAVVPSVRPGVQVQVTRDPLGVVGVITPWNFPLAIPSWKIAPAIAYGNSVVFKPATLVPASASALAEIVHRSGLPAGTLNLVVGSGSTVGEALLADPRVAAISFTGSTEVGARVARRCAERNARYQLEMGGKNPLIIVDDADLDTALDCAIDGAFLQQGQRCTASSRLIATSRIHDAFVEGLVARASRLRVGHALEADSDLGPIVDAAQLESNLRYVEIGKAEGAELAFGGRRLERPCRGHYMEPALFIGTRNDMRINQEEIFGPVAAVIKVDDYEEALAVANATPFGLSSGICTSSLQLAEHFRRHSAAGLVMINLPTAGLDYHVPFGGRKGSSAGPLEQGRQAAEFYTSAKVSYVRYN